MLGGPATRLAAALCVAVLAMPAACKRQGAVAATGTAGRGGAAGGSAAGQGGAAGGSLAGGGGTSVTAGSGGATGGPWTSIPVSRRARWKSPTRRNRHRSVCLDRLRPRLHHDRGEGARDGRVRLQPPGERAQLPGWRSRPTRDDERIVYYLNAVRRLSDGALLAAVRAAGDTRTICSQIGFAPSAPHVIGFQKADSAQAGSLGTTVVAFLQSGTLGWAPPVPGLSTIQTSIVENDVGWGLGLYDGTLRVMMPASSTPLAIVDRGSYPAYSAVGWGSLAISNPVLSGSSDEVIRAWDSATAVAHDRRAGRHGNPGRRAVGHDDGVGRRPRARA